MKTFCLILQIVTILIFISPLKSPNTDSKTRFSYKMPGSIYYLTSTRGKPVDLQKQMSIHCRRDICTERGKLLLVKQQFYTTPWSFIVVLSNE